MLHLLGAHLSIADGYHQAIKSIKNKGGNCLQIFSASPRGWSFPQPSLSQIELFTTIKKTFQVEPIYFHASYLINLATEDETAQKSVKNLINELNLAAKMQIRGSIIHLGSLKRRRNETKNFSLSLHKKDYMPLIKNITAILAATPPEVLFIIENAGNRKIGQTLDELALIINELANERIRVCLDTCHLHAAGYNLQTPEKFEQFFDHFDKLIGMKKLELFHLNDSRDAFGALRDRHENIGQGQVGASVFKLLLNHKLTKNKPFIIETPGFDGKGPDEKNLQILKSYIIK